MKQINSPKSQVTVIMPLKDLVLALIEAKDKLKVLDTEYEAQANPLKEAKKMIEAEIIAVFKARGEYSTRIEKATASMSVRKTAQIGDERVIIACLKEQGMDTYVEERVSDLFKDTVLKDQAKVEKPLAGVIIKETEFVSIRSNDKKDPRKLTTGEFVQIPGGAGGDGWQRIKTEKEFYDRD